MYFNQNNVKSTIRKDSILNLLWFSFNSFLKNTRMILFILVFPFSIWAFNIVLPFYSIAGAVMNCFIISTILIVVGITSRNLRVSTLFKNIHLNGDGKYKFYFTQAIFTFIVTVIVMAVFWIIFSVLCLLGLYNMQNYQDHLDGSGKLFSSISHNPLANGIWVALIILTIPTSLLSFSLYFIFYSLSKSDKTYFIYVVILMISGLIFGGTANYYFYLGVNTGNWNYYFYDHSSSFAEKIFWPSYILEPVFALGQTNANITSLVWNMHLTNHLDNGILDNLSYVFLVDTGSKRSHVGAQTQEFKSIMIILQPYIASAVYLTIGVLVSKYRKV